MYTTQDENGILNNYASEPQMYFAEFPSVEQQRQYMIQGGIAIILVTTLLGIALSVS